MSRKRKGDTERIVGGLLWACVAIPTAAWGLCKWLGRSFDRTKCAIDEKRAEAAESKARTEAEELSDTATSDNQREPDTDRRREAPKGSGGAHIERSTPRAAASTEAVKSAESTEAVKSAESPEAAKSAASEPERRFDVVLMSANARDPRVIKALRRLTGLGTADVKSLAATLPRIVRRSLSEEKAESIAAELRSVGAVAELKRPAKSAK